MLELRAKASFAETIPKSFIEEVLKRADIGELIGQSVQLKKQGANLIGLCPFHGEKSPSFSVSPQKQFYHCFGCGQSGDAIKFLTEYAGLSFREAITELAGQVNLPMPTGTGRSEPIVDTSALVNANNLAGRFFQHCLVHTDSAKEYLRKRKMPPLATKTFLIGYAPDEWQGLKEALVNYESGSECVEVGLVIDKDGRRYDRFRNRLMFGIRDARGRLVGFGGRSMDDKIEPKYLNSPQSSLFDKSNTLFGIFEARDGIRKTKQVLVTEGYMDTVALSVHGVTQTVATMGTACTHQHLERLLSLADEIIFSFDGDKAGENAAWKTLNLCLPYAQDGKTFRFLLLPSGMDPDETILKEGLAAFQHRINTALSLSGFLIQKLASENDGLKTSENKAKFLLQGTELIKQLPFGGKLYKFIKDDLHKASQISGAEISTLVRKNAGNQSKDTAWSTLASAARSQKATTASVAESLLSNLTEEQQNAFFNRDFTSLPIDQRQFWECVFNAVIEEEPVDEKGEIDHIQKDLLMSANRIIQMEIQKARRESIRNDYRSGAISEKDLLDHTSAMSKEPARNRS